MVVRTIESEKNKLNNVPERLVPQVKKARPSGMQEAIRMAKIAEPKEVKVQRAEIKWFHTL